MKKIFYSIGLSIVAFIPVASAMTEVLGHTNALEEENNIYNEEIKELKLELENKDSYILECEDSISSYDVKLAEYVNIVNVSMDRITELENLLEAQQKSRKIVFDPADVTIPSNVSVEELTLALSGTNLEPLAYKFVEIEENKGINAIYLASKTAWESGWGTSNFAVSRNNLGGVKNRDGKGFRTFPSQEACLDYISDFLVSSYLNENGKYYNGKSIHGIAQKYNLGEQTWIDGITSIGHSLVSKIQ